VVGAKMVNDSQEVMLTTDNGQVIRMKVSDISVLGRNTQGVRLINLEGKNELVTGLAVMNDSQVVDAGGPEGTH
jgi:DNA gyrase subunit A